MHPLQLTTTQTMMVAALAAVVILGMAASVLVYRHHRLPAHGRKGGHGAGVDEDDSFESRIPEYASTVKAWFDSEHPYFNQSFKLADVSAVVPLNRTYLSRIFNEGLGESFSDYVRDRRMAEAMRLLVDEPDTPIADIAEHCGFASHSSFHRAFVRFTGMKPGDYRSGSGAA